MADIKYEIVEYIGMLSENPRGWKTELIYSRQLFDVKSFEQ